MLTNIYSNIPYWTIVTVIIVATFIITMLVLKTMGNRLPTDNGKALAVEGSVSKGKPTGAGVLFISTFVILAFLLVPWSLENLVFYVLIEAAMLTGFLDDRSSKPWSEYIKGVFDLGVSFFTALTFAVFSGTELFFPIFDKPIQVPFVIFVALGTLLVWVAINSTNCTDGVDGLSTSLSLVSIASILAYSLVINRFEDNTSMIFVMIGVLLAYLWFNTNPSQLLMGDAGSRALGVFFAICIMSTRQPFLYIIFCGVFLVDGMAGIIKISLKRFLKISVLKKTTTPIHDHLRKKIGWSNPQVTLRLAMIQAFISFIYLAIVYTFLQRR